MTTLERAAAIRRDVLPWYPGWETSHLSPLGGGLINETYLLTTAASEAGGVPARAVLQRLSPVFSPAIHENIRAVTEHLAAAGVVTPRLLPTREGGTHVVLEPGGDSSPGAGVWRLQTFIDGVAFDVVESASQAFAAAACAARFHAALADLSHVFVGLRRGVHDTPAHLARLREAVGAEADHRLHGLVAPLAGQILEGAASLPPLPPTPARTGHGDLKFNNILFAGREKAARDEAVCLIDLDTVGPVLLAHELGDAWRSWCNRAGEDAADAALDLEVFAASWEGYASVPAVAVSGDERRALLLGVEWISLELAARFLADALRESYFGWNPARFASRGEHNLLRARGQWSLHEALVASRPARARILGVPL